MDAPAAISLRPWFIGLQVLDLEASARFYRDVIGVPLEQVSDDIGDPWLKGRRYRALWGGGTVSFTLYAAVPGDETMRARVGFAVRDLDAAHARAVAAGADVLHPPRKEPFGRVARYRDPDGNIVGLTQWTTQGA